DRNVTGVQTCALPISTFDEGRRGVLSIPCCPHGPPPRRGHRRQLTEQRWVRDEAPLRSVPSQRDWRSGRGGGVRGVAHCPRVVRSEERRVGQERSKS